MSVWRRPDEESADIYKRVNALIPRLVAQEAEDGPGDFSVIRVEKKEDPK